MYSVQLNSEHDSERESDSGTTFGVHDPGCERFIPSLKWSLNDLSLEK